MGKHTLVIWGLLAATSSPARPVQLLPKAIYGSDDRIDSYEATTNVHLLLRDSSVALVDQSNLIYQASTKTFSLISETLADRVGVCSDARYAEQPAAAFCSGVLVTPTLVLTAGHCLQSSVDCSTARFVFGYRKDTADTVQTTIPAQDVIGCKRIVKRNQEPTGADWALIELKAPAKNHSTLPLSRANAVVGQDLLIAGYPSGLPLKLGTGQVLGVQSTHFETNLDTFGGNSGSPVTDSAGRLLGLLVRGQRDYHFDAAEGRACYVESTYANSGDGAEDVTNVTMFSGQFSQVAPAKPTGFSLVGRFDSIVDFSWTLRSTDGGYVSTVSEGEAIPSCQGGTDLGSRARIRLKSLKPSTVYKVAFCARNVFGDLSKPVIARFVTSKPFAPPPVAFQSRRSPSSTETVIRWTSGGRNTTQFVTSLVTGPATKDLSCTSGSPHTIEASQLVERYSGLVPGSTYTFLICAKSELGLLSPLRRVTFRQPL